MRLGFFANPVVAIVLPVVVCALVWAVPGESYSLRGFAARAEVTPVAILIILAWYTLCILAFSLGRSIERSHVTRRGVTSEVDNALTDFDGIARQDRVILRILTLTATLGVGYVLLVITTTSSIDTILAEQRGNELLDALPGGSSAATLRYASIVSAPIAVYLWRRGQVAFPVAVYNVVLLLVQSTLSSRLSLLAATVVFIVLLTSTSPQIKIPWRRAAMIGALLFALLTTLNFYRNANFYEANGVDNPIQMNFYQFATYLGAPWQAQLGVAGGLLSGQFQNQSSLLAGMSIVTPSFIRSEAADKAAARNADYYQYLVDLALNLNTNSVLADGMVTVGVWGLVWALMGLVVAGVVYEYFLRQRTVARAGAGIMLYCLYELWRVYLLSTGLVIFIVFSLLFAHSFAVRGKAAGRGRLPLFDIRSPCDETRAQCSPYRTEP